MFKSLIKFARVGANAVNWDDFEPIYGLPKRSLDEWLARNPRLKKDYENELSVRGLRRRAMSDARRRNDGGRSDA